MAADPQVRFGPPAPHPARPQAGRVRRAATGVLESVVGNAFDAAVVATAVSNP